MANKVDLIAPRTAASATLEKLNMLLNQVGSRLIEICSDDYLLISLGRSGSFTYQR